LGALIILIIPVLYMAILTDLQKNNRGKNVTLYSSLIIIGIMLSSNIDWIKGWDQNRYYSFNNIDTNKFKTVQNVYDFQVIGYNTSVNLRFSLLGQLNYMSPERYPGVKTKRTTPEREIRYLINRELCISKPICLLNVNGVDKILTKEVEFTEFDLYRELLKS
jgi:hypothetical protein